jgi:hypothetical protein
MFAPAIALTMMAAPQVAAAYQSQQGMEHGRGHNKDRGHDRDDVTNNPNYQRGVTQGQNDGRRNRSQQYRATFNNDWDRRAYRAGYDQGFQAGLAQYNSRPSSGRYGHGGQYGQNGQSGRNGQYGQYGSQAAQIGAQDGMNDGRSDRATGHSNRPTQGDNYKNALRGYNSSFGGETAYKASYRQAYGPAYQQGYNGQGYRQ